jgi:hypothetical protein
MKATVSVVIAVEWQDGSGHWLRVFDDPVEARTFTLELKRLGWGSKTWEL